MRRLTLVLTGALAIATAPALAREHGIGKPVVQNGMIFRPVYLQPVHMAPAPPGLNANDYDIHLELDIHAGKHNPRGFSPGDWIPYLTVSYLLQKQGSDWTGFGTMMAMTANDGPHYGANVKLDGPGKYRIGVKILPPPYRAFFRHTSTETGVPQWWGPIRHDWTFTYVGVGKKGGY
ncbi:MAG TPA: iron transporter [Gammaproteobacteria bacterium]|nr:iron transporter [Gammaproteobacteria bacterium]